jgi:hypothetical protein
VFDTKVINLFGQPRRDNHEDLIATFSRGPDEGHQGIEVPRQSRRAEK